MVVEKQSNRLIRMEVQPRHTIGSIIETIVDRQKMDKSRGYKLALGNRSFGREHYLLTVQKAGISHGDHLFLDEIVSEAASRIEIQKESEEKKAILEPKLCLKCGKPLRAGSRFCLACGASTRRET
nr:zinc ribbon domain-containing protein [Candidatus Njordarchaeum guaymaensis]